MSSQAHAPEHYDPDFVAVDAARLLLILARFARPLSAVHEVAPSPPQHPVIAHFSPEYYLHKLDFLLRYPGYLVYELTELHRLRVPAAADRGEVLAAIRSLFTTPEPRQSVLPFKKFWYGAYERLDDVESFWHSRGLVYTRTQPRGDGRSRKHYFLTQLAADLAADLPTKVRHARWYADRISLIHRFFNELSPGEVKELQYRHPEYRRAQLQEVIPDLDAGLISANFADVFGEALEAHLE